MTTSPASFDNSQLIEHVRASLVTVRNKIGETGRDPSSVRIVAVTKTFGTEAVLAAHAAGLTSVGENYLNELSAKREALADLAVNWHYLGALQTNKIGRIAAVADVVSGVSRAKEIERLAALTSTVMIDIQVDVTGMEQRNGAAPADVVKLVAFARSLSVRVRGLMIVAPPDPVAAQRAFATVGALADEAGVVERSMGMSDDYESACRAGSTELRLGRVLFGARVPLTELS
jgi:pyridoxal phosphate enzyme (YggS family)